MGRIIAAALGVSLLASASPACAQDKTTIEKLNDTFEALLQKNNLKALAEMYTEDAYLLPPGGEMIQGRAAIQAFWAKAADGLANLELTTLDVKTLSPDTAQEIGGFVLSTKTVQQPITGKYVVIWRRAGSEWKLATDIWNNNK